MTEPKLLPAATVFMFLLLFLPFGCAPLQPPADPIQARQADDMARSITRVNQDIITSKGMGYLIIDSPGQSHRYKLAWAAAAPNRLRATLLASGFPFETIVATGEKIKFISHTGSHEPYTARSKDPNLEDIIKVPVRLSDLLSVLLGRLPIKNYDVASFSPGDPSMKTLILKKHWSPTRQTVFVDAQGLPKGLDFFDNNGQLSYRIRIISYNKKIPAVIEVTDSQQRKVRLKITAFQENPQIKPAAFQLTPKGS